MTIYNGISYQSEHLNSLLEKQNGDQHSKELSSNSGESRNDVWRV